MIKSIIVHVDFDAFPAARVRFASDLADRLGATLTGFSAGASEPARIEMVGAAIPISMPPVAQLSALAAGAPGIPRLSSSKLSSIMDRLESSEAEFRAAAVRPVEWISTVDLPTRALADAAASADLVIAERTAGMRTLDSVDIGELLARAGRPVLLPPRNGDRLNTDTIFVAWKDTTEARRAVRDALPFLSRAKHVVVATISNRDDDDARSSVDRVVRYLSRYNMSARAEVRAGLSTGPRLVEMAQSLGAGLIVGGAYGHSRAREWIFGGVTRTLLESQSISRLMSG